MSDAGFLLEQPRWLWAIWAVPLFALAWWARMRRNRATLAAHFSRELRASLAASVSPGRRALKIGLTLGAVFFFAIALSDPKWGLTEQTVFSRGRDVLILLDVSKSMLAADVAPSRLERVKLDIQDMLGAARGDRIGLIAFAGMPVLKCPLTTDHAFFRRALDRAGPNSVSRGGTFIGDAIRLGVEALADRGQNQRVMILISDGEDQGSFPIDAARDAAAQGIRIYTVGIGDRDVGGRIEMNGDFVRDDGKIVWSKLNPEELRNIAAETGGAYIPAGTRSVDLDRIYRQKISVSDAGELEESKRKYLESRYQLFLLVGLIFLLAEPFVADRRRLVENGVSA